MSEGRDGSHNQAPDGEAGEQRLRRDRYYQMTAHVTVPQHVNRTWTHPPTDTLSLKIQD